MNYDEALAFIKDESGRGIQPGLDRVKRLLHSLGDPQDAVPVIHVAGTNGKGSVCSYISSILMTQGYHTGRFISPQVFGYREMIQYDGIWISKEDLAMLCSRIKQCIEKDEFLSSDRPTRFEIETAAAYLFFKIKNVDVAVVETGMGGSLDATNAADDPLVSVITSVSIDHKKFLGDTIEKIAAQKGGIIKPLCPVVYISENPAVSNVLEDIAREKDAPSFAVSSADIIRYGNSSAGIPEYQRFKCYGLDLETAMAGVYEVSNAALAVRTCMVIRAPRYNSCGSLETLSDVSPLCMPDEPVPAKDELCVHTSVHDSRPSAIDKNNDLIISDISIKTGIKNARWPGRFDVMRGPVTVIIDGAHNPDGARKLRESLEYYNIEQKIMLIMAVFKDKDYESMLSIMSGVSDSITVFRAPGPRGLDAGILAESASKYFTHVYKADNPEEACALAYSIAVKRKGILVQFGTLSIIKDTYGIWNGLKDKCS